MNFRLHPGIDLGGTTILGARQFTVPCRAQLQSRVMIGYWSRRACRCCRFPCWVSVDGPDRAVVRANVHRTAERDKATSAHLRRWAERYTYPPPPRSPRKTWRNRNVLYDWPYVRLRADLAREVARAGHAIGNHTYTHPPLTFQTGPQIRAQLEECEKVLAEAIGDHARILSLLLFGARRPAVLRIAREMGLEPVMWNVTGNTWNAPSVEAIEMKVSRRIRGGNVILLQTADIWVWAPTGRKRSKLQID